MYEYALDELKSPSKKNRPQYAASFLKEPPTQRTHQPEFEFT